ncbi:ABC transporter permease [Clostridium beijerinckii]|uniref:Choline transport system permease protein OpuBB n=1 Tax=Clostridium beijerinckii TaxID=1520 RepID=A0A1B9BLP2_CLOBE|nr:ABC transporter permease [Clostridium beijerinckii]AQS06302.1 choline transport system permease protein OpuBB [Clostridium beijerinckii]MBA2888346.1 osmoprotectant transport system permease protein [Clostridium beijerinckii]MBA2903114.1 osmoprotectant transport system permease protein [Clostridium beijerinckii]MBA2912924.1 osmoprotectant transport system permease protein [Clostridium beijerinckii]MBA9014085.1 osmoprotectant transport system permease protein [Clostridium beijerinckii]
MIDYLLKYPDKLLKALVGHIEIVLITLVISIILAALLTILAAYSKIASKLLVNIFAMIYSIPSLALFAILVPITGLGKVTAIIVLVLYNQYILLRNTIDGLNNVDASIVEAATGMGMSKSQILFQVKLPLVTKPIFAGIHLAVVSTIGIATIAASINAGGIGSVLLDGLRTVNTAKILWGTLMSAGLAIVVNAILNLIEKKIT